MSTKSNEEHQWQTPIQRRKSRDAARYRRGKQHDEFVELAEHLPIAHFHARQLDRMSIVRLANSFLKIKNVVAHLKTEGRTIREARVGNEAKTKAENFLTEALDGFVLVVGANGKCLYVSDSVGVFLGLSPVEMIGSSFYNFVHPCDHEEISKELCGKIPLEDMEIFDGLFCSDSVVTLSNNLKRGSKVEIDVEKRPYRSFFVRLKSTLTSRGKSVSIRSSTYRVVQCVGRLKNISTVKDGPRDSLLCFIGIGVPLMFSPTFEVPLDRDTFTTHHNLNMTFLYSEREMEHILGYTSLDVLGQSLFQFVHAADQEVLACCHKTLLTKGQSVSGYYRLLAKYGGWVWVQTKASIVYASKTCQPQFVLCIHYAISDVKEPQTVLSLDQMQQLRKRNSTPRNSPTEQRKKLYVSKIARPPVICYQEHKQENCKTNDRNVGNKDTGVDPDAMDLDSLVDVIQENGVIEATAFESEKYFRALDMQSIPSSDEDVDDLVVNGDLLAQATRSVANSSNNCCSLNSKNITNSLEMRELLTAPNGASSINAFHSEPQRQQPNLELLLPRSSKDNEDDLQVQDMLKDSEASTFNTGKFVEPLNVTSKANVLPSKESSTFRDGTGSSLNPNWQKLTANISAQTSARDMSLNLQTQIASNGRRQSLTVTWQNNLNSVNGVRKEGPMSQIPASEKVLNLNITADCRDKMEDCLDLGSLASKTSGSQIYSRAFDEKPLGVKFPMSHSEKISMNSPAIPSPGHDSKFLCDTIATELYAHLNFTANADDQFLTDEKELEFFNVAGNSDSSMQDCDDMERRNETYTFLNDFDPDLGTKCFVRRNLSTPTFSSSVEAS